MLSKPDTGRAPGTTAKMDKKKTFLACPACKHDSCGVNDVINVPGKKIRTRVCDRCGCVFVTTETITTVYPDLFGSIDQAGRSG